MITILRLSLSPPLDVWSVDDSHECYHRPKGYLSDEMLDKYFKDRKIDVVISDIQ